MLDIITYFFISVFFSWKKGGWIKSYLSVFMSNVWIEGFQEAVLVGRVILSKPLSDDAWGSKHLQCFLLFPVLKTHSGDPFDSLPKNFWYELSSPFTESYDDLTEPEPNTTPDPLPFFEDHSNSTNVTTQLGSSVFLHCKVHDLRDRTVSS